MKTPLEKSLSLALTYSSGEQYKLNVARFAPPKILSAGTPMGRGGRLDAHGARVYLIIRLACEVANLYPTENTFGGDPELPHRSSGGCAACERLTERRVKPSPKECSLCSGTLYQTFIALTLSFR